VFTKIKETAMVLSEDLVASNSLFETIYGESFQTLYFLSSSRLMFKGLYQIKQPYTCFFYPGSIIQDGDVSFTRETFLHVDCPKDFLSDDLIPYIRMKAFEKIAPLHDDQALNTLQMTKLYGFQTSNDLLTQSSKDSKENSLKNIALLTLLPYENDVKEWLSQQNVYADHLRYVFQIALLNFPLNEEKSLSSQNHELILEMATFRPGIYLVSITHQTNTVTKLIQVK
jgi:hypothetical protein